jgi:outer membrane protein W
MKTNAVKPYIGVGFGQHLAKTHRVSLAVDAQKIQTINGYILMEMEKQKEILQ